MRHDRGGGGGHGGQELWLITYGDLVTLLMAFFVMLYASLTGKAQGAGEAVSEAVRKYQMEVFQQISSGAQGGMIMMPGSNKMNLMQSSGPNLLQRDLADWTSSVTGYADVQESGDQIKVTLGADLLFDSASANIRPDGLKALQDLATILLQHPGDITVTGHTDSRPFGSGNSEYGDNWMLSSVRAVNVVRVFQKAGLRPRRLKAVGYGSTRPRKAEGQTGDAFDAWQRRVEIIITPISDLLESQQGLLYSESEAVPVASSSPRGPEPPPGFEGVRLFQGYDVPPTASTDEPRPGPLGEPPEPGSVAVDREKPEGMALPLPPMPGRRTTEGVQPPTAGLEGTAPPTGPERQATP